MVRPSRGLEKFAVVFLQLFAAGTDIDVGFGVEDEVAAGKGSVHTLGFVHQFHVRLDPALVHQPPDHVGRAVTRVGDQARRREIKSLSRAIEHGLGRADFGLASGGRRLDVHDHRVFKSTR